jgi:hypothetical protein
VRLVRGVPWLSLVAVAACSAATQGGRAPGARDENLVTATELRAATATNLYDFIQSQRPRWLERTHAAVFRPEQVTTVAVFVDNQYFGGPDALRQLATGAASELRYYGPSEAEMRFGVGYKNGVIQVITRPS